MKAHGIGSGSGGEDSFKGGPQLMGRFATEDLWQHCFREGGHQHAEDELILLSPSKGFTIDNDDEGVIGGGGLVREGDRAVNKAIEVKSSKVRFNLGTPSEEIVFSELGGDQVGKI